MQELQSILHEHLLEHVNETRLVNRSHV